MDLQKIMDRNKWCSQPMHLCKIAADGSARKGKLVEYDLPKPKKPFKPTGIFLDHSCYRCKDGEKACIRGNPHQCDYPHARND